MNQNLPFSSKASANTGDGAPAGARYTPPQEAMPSRKVESNLKGPRTPRFKKADFLRAEGPRGISVRATVWIRHLGYFAAIILGAVITESALTGVTSVKHGGLWLLGAVALIYTTATVGSIAFPDARNEFVEEARHYVFGITLIPGTVLALIMFAVSKALAEGSDAFSRTLDTALPIMFVCAVLIPSVLFVRLVAGRRYFNMSRGDDEQALRKYTRQGFLQQ